MNNDTQPIVKRLDLPVTPERAFEHFTKGIHLWWPLQGHSLAEDKADTVVFEAREGGRLYEIDTDGNEREWGRVIECEPPHLLVYSWVLERPSHATEVEVRFEPGGEHGTAMTLIHRGWDGRPDGAAGRVGYDGGWDGVLACYREALD